MLRERRSRRRSPCRLAPDSFVHFWAYQLNWYRCFTVYRQAQYAPNGTSSPAKSERSVSMLRNRAEISEDKSFGPLTDAILERDQPRTSDLFFQMVAKEGRSIGDALAVVTAAEAPFVQVPSHINIKDGQVSLVNNDHTILGLRASACLMPYLPEKYRLLPL